MRWIIAMMALASFTLGACAATTPPLPPAETSPLPTAAATSPLLQAAAIESEEQAVYLPSVINATPPVYEFSRTSVQGCNPNPGVTYVEGNVYKDAKPANGYNVVFSYQPDGPIVAEITSGPHPNYEGWRPGYYSHIISGEGAREGDWYFWITDDEKRRISNIAHIHTDADAGEGKCQQGRISFGN